MKAEVFEIFLGFTLWSLLYYGVRLILRGWRYFRRRHQERCIHKTIGRVTSDLREMHRRDALVCETCGRRGTYYGKVDLSQRLGNMPFVIVTVECPEGCGRIAFEGMFAE